MKDIITVDIYDVYDKKLIEGVMPVNSVHDLTSFPMLDA